jgi:hypothetical protein
MMSNRRMRSDCECLVAPWGSAGCVADAVEGSRESSACTLLVRSFAEFADDRSQIDLRGAPPWAAHERRHLNQGEDSALAISFAMAFAAGRSHNSNSAFMPELPAPSRTSDHESPPELPRYDEEAAPLPHWMRVAHPSRGGTFAAGLLIALAVVAAASGILSTVLELAWL